LLNKHGGSASLSQPGYIARRITSTKAVINYAQRGNFVPNTPALSHLTVL